MKILCVCACVRLSIIVSLLSRILKVFGTEAFCKSRVSVFKQISLVMSIYVGLSHAHRNVGVNIKEQNVVIIRILRSDLCFLS